MKKIISKITSKIILHYLGEILIVFIGVFIAFQLSNYKEENIINSSSKSSLNRILSDLKTEKKWLVQEKKVFEKNKSYLKNILQGKTNENLDSLAYYSFYRFTHYNFGSEYSTLKYSGKLNLVKNDSLRYFLVGYYETAYSFYETIAEEHKHFFRETLEKQFKKITSDSLGLYNSEIIKHKLKEKEFKNALIDQREFFDHITNKVKIERLDFLIELINKELKTITNNGYK